jgi:hypothetical protein
MKNAYKILVEKPERTRPLARQRCRWEDIVRMDLKYGDNVWTGLMWIGKGTCGGLF